MARALASICAGSACWAAAAEPAARAGGEPPHLEAWSGGEAFHDLRSVYGGASWAPFGSVQEDGFRLRAVLGYADYRQGTVAFGDLLAGWHKQLGPVTLKVLGGMTVADHHPVDPMSSLEGTDIGAKGIVEAWWAISDPLWACADLSFGSLQWDHSARLRLGWRLWPELSAGIESGSSGTWGHDIGRAGGFLRYEWASGEVSISAGASFEGPTGGWEGTARPFATVSVLTRF